MNKAAVILMGVVIIVASAISLLIHRQAQNHIRENEALLREQGGQLAALAGERQRLTNLVAQAGISVAPARDHSDELARLRAQVAALRQQTNQLGSPVAENRIRGGVSNLAFGDSHLLHHNHELNITFRGGPRETGKLGDARGFGAAVAQYAEEHQGEFPSSLDQVAPYLPKPLETNSPPWANPPVTGTNDFEMIFQGSQNDLTNIPLRRVALLREKQPWLNVEGKWTRVYGYADGAASTVVSDDNFQSWEAQHLVPSTEAK